MQIQLLYLMIYYRHYFISPDATFTSNIWSDLEITAVRTTNGRESHHSVSNKRFYRPHRITLNFIDELIEIQSETHVKLRSTNHL